MCVIPECFQYSSINNKHCIIELSNGDICFLFANFYQIKAHISVLFANILFVFLMGQWWKRFPSSFPQQHQYGCYYFFPNVRKWNIRNVFSIVFHNFKGQTNRNGKRSNISKLIFSDMSIVTKNFSQYLWLLKRAEHNFDY